MKKAKVINYKLKLTGIWLCPHCNTEVEISFNPSVYTAVSDDPCDEECPNCKEFFTLSFIE